MSRISIASWEILSVDKDEDYEDEVDVRLAFPQSNKALWIAVTQNSNATHFQPNLPRIQQHGAHAYRIMLESCAKSQAYLPTAASFHSLVAISLKPVCAFFHYSAQVTHQLTLPWSFGPEPSWHMVPNTEFRRDLRIPYTTARQTQPASRADHIETPAVLSAARRLEELGHIDNALDVVF